MNHRRSLTSFVLATLLATAAAAPSQAQLNGTYTFGAVFAEFDQACVLPEIVLSAQYGTMSFLPNFTFTISSLDYEACSGGGSSTSPGSDSGTYTLSSSGKLVLDFNPTFPGTDTATLQLTWDERGGVLVEACAGCPTMAVMVRQGSGMSVADLSGAYSATRLSHLQIPGGIESEGALDSAVFDGAGGFVASAEWRIINPFSDTTGTDPSSAGSYTVSPNGAFSTNPGPARGAIAPDGSFGFEMDMSGQRAGISILVRNPVGSPTTDAFDGAWWLSELGADKNAEIEPNASAGTVTLNASASTYSYSGTESWVDSFTGGGSSPDTSSGTYTLGSDGALTFTPLPLTQGWLADSEDMAIYADLNSVGSVLSGVLVREWGPLETDVSSLSIAAGGTQALSIRAGSDQAGSLYFVLGSLAGTYPGVPYAGVTVPLNLDGYALFTISNPNTPPLGNSLSILDGAGKGNATFTLGPAQVPALVGLVANHACLILNAGAGPPVALVSNPKSLTFLP